MLAYLFSERNSELLLVSESQHLVEIFPQQISKRAIFASINAKRDQEKFTAFGYFGYIYYLVN